MASYLFQKRLFPFLLHHRQLPCFHHHHRILQHRSFLRLRLFSMSTEPKERAPLPAVPGTDPSRCMLDSYRIAIAQMVADALGLTVEQVYPGVQYGKKGVDFTVALPRFRLPGKVDDLAKKVIEKVSLFYEFYHHCQFLTKGSSNRMTTSHLSNTTKLSYTSCSTRITSPGISSLK